MLPLQIRSSLWGPHWPGVVAPDRVLCIGQIELMQNWIVYNRTVFDIETVLTLFWIVWNRTVLTFDCIWTNTILIQNWIVSIGTVWLNWYSLK